MLFARIVHINKQSASNALFTTKQININGSIYKTSITMTGEARTIR